MDRIIKFSDLEKAVDEVYNEYKSLEKGEVDSRLEGADTNAFGISLTLTDGTTINRGDVDVKTPLGAIAKVPTALLLLSQYSPAEILEKGIVGRKCGKGGKGGRGGHGRGCGKPEISLSTHGIRAVSAVEPANDSDGKWELMINNMINLMGSSPELDDKFYEAQLKVNEQENVENALAAADFYLYDNAATAIDLYSRLISMKASATQLSTMAATIAADGYNPVTKQNVFDGAVSSKVVALMAAHGPHRMNDKWLFKAGLPAKRSFGGTICGVLPGVFGVAAYSPLLNHAGVSVRSAKAIAALMGDKLGLSVFDSAKVRVEK